MAFRIVFWVALGLAAAALLQVRHLADRRRDRRCWSRVNFVIKGGRATLAHRCASSLVDGASQALPVGIACAIVGVIIGVLTLTGAASNFAGFVLHGRREEPVPVAAADDDRLPDPRHGHPDDPQLHHHQRDRGARAAEARRAADRVAHVRLLFRHHGRPDAAGGAGGVRRRVDRQGVADEDRLEGDAHRHRRLRRFRTWRSTIPR